MGMTTEEQNVALRKALGDVIDERDRFAANISRLEALLVAAAPDVAKSAGVGTSQAHAEIRAGLATVGPYGSNATAAFVRAGIARTTETKKSKGGPISGAIGAALAGKVVKAGDLQ